VTMTREDESTSPMNHKIVNIVSKYRQTGQNTINEELVIAAAFAGETYQAAIYSTYVDAEKEERTLGTFDGFASWRATNEI
jgi:propanediol dehydratase small subunit